MSNKRKKRKIPTVSNTKKNVTTEQPIEHGIYIDLVKYPKWTHSVTVDKFTNHLHDVEESNRHFYLILSQLLPYTEETGEQIFSNKEKHCHKLDKNSAQYNLAYKIISKLYDNKIEDGLNIWQIGFKQDIRIFGSLVNRTFYPLFIDHHHLVFPSKKYNDTDYTSYKYAAQNILN